MLEFTIKGIFTLCICIVTLETTKKSNDISKMPELRSTEPLVWIDCEVIAHRLQKACEKLTLVSDDWFRGR